MIRLPNIKFRGLLAVTARRTICPRDLCVELLSVTPDHCPGGNLRAIVARGAEIVSHAQPAKLYFMA